MNPSIDPRTLASLARTQLETLEADTFAEALTDPLPLWLPPLNGVTLRQMRGRLRDALPSPLERAETLALLRHGPQLTTLPEQYPRNLLLSLAAKMSLPAALELVRSWPSDATLDLARRRQEEAGELELFAEDLGCLGGTVGAWISEEMLEQHSGGSPERRVRLLAAMRWLRLHQVVSNRWAAETLFPRLVRPDTGAMLIWTVGAPLAIDRLEALIDIDALVAADDLTDSRSAAGRRREMVDRVRHRLRQGLRVGCVANHSTLESREALVSVAREVGAGSHAIFFDLSDDELMRRNEAAGWPVPLRVVERVQESLEAPRPHEAEQVWVMGDSGPLARWELGEGMLEGFRETMHQGS